MRLATEMREQLRTRMQAEMQERHPEMEGHRSEMGPGHGGGQMGEHGPGWGDGAA